MIKVEQDLFEITAITVHYQYGTAQGIEVIINECNKGLEDISQMHIADCYKKLIGYEKELDRFANLRPKIIL